VLEAIKTMSEKELQKTYFDARVQSAMETSVYILPVVSAERDVELQLALVQDTIAKEEREALDDPTLHFVIEVSLQGFDVVVGSDTIETNPGVAPLHPYPVTTKDEVVVDAMLAQPISEANISRLESIYGAIELVPFHAKKFRLEIKKRVEIVVPQLLTNIFNKLHQRLSRLDGDLIEWLLPLRSQPQTELELVSTLDKNVSLYHGFKGYRLSEGQTRNQAWRENMDIGTQHLDPEM